MQDNIKLVEQFLAHYKNQVNASKYTIVAYGHDLKQFLYYIEDKSKIYDLEKVKKENVHGYVDFLNQYDYKVKSIKRHLCSVRSFYNYLNYMEIVENNPFLKFRLDMKEPKRIISSLTLDEIKSMILHASKNFSFQDKRADVEIINPKGLYYQQLRDILVLEFLFATGLRVSELCDIKLEDISKDLKSYKIMGKGDRERTAIIENEGIIKIINFYLFIREKTRTASDYFLINKDGKKTDPQSIRLLIEKHAKGAGIGRHITPHDFRHAFASLILEQGVDIKYIQEFMGHSSINTTQIYLHTTQKRKSEIIKTMHPRELLNFDIDYEDKSDS